MSRNIEIKKGWIRYKKRFKIVKFNFEIDIKFHKESYIYLNIFGVAKSGNRKGRC